HFPQCTTLPYDGGVARSPKLSTTPTFVIPMAAVPVTELPEGPDWLYELKLDGYRALIVKDKTKLQLRSRNDKDLTRMHPRVAAADQKLKADRVVLDGEIVALDASGRPSFQTLQHRGSNPSHTIVFYAFDVLHVNGRDVVTEPLEKRRARLPEIVAENG